MLPKRDTRAQLVIVENGRYVMLQHHIKQKGIFAWGIPGGGVEAGETEAEAAVREAFEETGLTVRLLPRRFERILEGNPVYRRAVTFVAVPIAGDAVLGEEPEEEMKDYYALTGIKWHPLRNREIPPLALEDTEPVLRWLDSGSVEKASNHIVCDLEGNRVLAKECGNPFFDEGESEWRRLEERTPVAEILDGNFTDSGKGIRFETTSVHRVDIEDFADCEIGDWVPVRELAGRIGNLGVLRHLTKK